MGDGAAEDAAGLRPRSDKRGCDNSDSGLLNEAETFRALPPEEDPAIAAAVAVASLDFRVPRDVLAIGAEVIITTPLSVPVISMMTF